MAGWAGHPVGDPGSEMGCWPPGMEAGASFPSAPPAMGVHHGGLPFADQATQACQLAPALEQQVQSIGLRVQKLERSRGQITKDLSDMLSDARELKKKVSWSSGPPVSAAADQKAAVAPVTGAAAIKVPASPEAPQVFEEHADCGPPGLTRRAARTKTAPSSTLARIVEEQSSLVAKSSSEKIPPPPGLSLPSDGLGQLKDSLTVQVKEVDGVEVSHAEWRIDNAKAKFKDCVGRPLVSPQFDAGGLSELRLMVSPNLGIDVSGLTMREQKSRYEARLAEGPLSGALQLKVVTSNGDKIRFSLFVGEISEGPLEYDFRDHIIHGADFNSNWLDQMKGGSLIVGVDLYLSQGQAQLQKSAE